MNRYLLLLLAILPLQGITAIDAYPFPDEEMRERYHQLIDELRCPQCLNTNLAGSDAMIAQDLRREVHRLILEGKSDQEILDFMYDRYGDFILYSPKITTGTILLWFGPALLLVIALAVWVRFSLARRASESALSDVDEARLNQLLNRK